MNKIVGVSFSVENGEENCKYLKVISTCRQDEVTISTKSGEYVCRDGSIAVIPAFTSHNIKGGSQGTITLLIEQPLLALKSVTVTDDVANGGVRLAAEQAATFQSVENGTGILNALGELIVNYIAFKCAKAEKSPVVAMLREDIERGARDWAYSVEAYMRKLPLNYDYVRKLFKNETGLTPHEYLTAVRMERAGKILLSGVSNRYSSYTIGQIAEACGYAEPLYFSRVFKKYYGVSPTEYSKRKNT